MEDSVPPDLKRVSALSRDRQQTRGCSRIRRTNRWLRPPADPRKLTLTWNLTDANRSSSRYSATHALTGRRRCAKTLLCPGCHPRSRCWSRFASSGLCKPRGHAADPRHLAPPQALHVQNGGDAAAAAGARALRRLVGAGHADGLHESMIQDTAVTQLLQNGQQHCLCDKGDNRCCGLRHVVYDLTPPSGATWS